MSEFVGLSKDHHDPIWNHDPDIVAINPITIGHLCHDLINDIRTNPNPNDNALIGGSLPWDFNPQQDPIDLSVTLYRCGFSQFGRTILKPQYRTARFHVYVRNQYCGHIDCFITQINNSLSWSRS